MIRNQYIYDIGLNSEYHSLSLIINGLREAVVVLPKRFNLSCAHCAVIAASQQDREVEMKRRSGDPQSSVQRNTAGALRSYDQTQVVRGLVYAVALSAPVWLAVGYMAFRPG